jgi:DNA-binding CsgD family transcriptional regulator/GAF domain-containing protein
MIRNDEHLLALTDTIHSAGLGMGGWGPALEAIAGATGSRTGQLIGVGSDTTLPFNFMTNADPGFAEDFARAGGGDPAINPRVRAGASVPVLKILTESDYLTEDEYKRHPFVQNVGLRWGYAFTCLTPLERRDGMLFGLAVLRTTAEGHIQSAEREAFTALAPHMRAAVRTQLALEGQAADLLAGAMEKLTVAAFICDRHGYVRRMTPAAERIVTDGTTLRLRSNRLHAARAQDLQALERAMVASPAIRLVGETSPGLRSVVLRGEGEANAPLVLDVIDLAPARSELGFAPTTLVIARGESHGDVRRAAIVRTAFELSGAETEVALQLCKGYNAEAIAQRRRVSVDTVRAQIKKISAKLGVKSQIELVAKINRL